MSLRTEVLNGLDATGSIPPGAPQTLSWPTPTGPLAAHLTALDRVGVAFDDLTLKAPALANASIDRLKLIADKLSAKLTYLLEDVGPVEIDSEGATVQLRSKTPYRDGERGAYYEIFVRRTGVSLDRFEFIHKTPGRNRVPVEVTREVLVRLADDFVAAVK